MADTLSASKQGLAIANQARQRRGWTKTSTARWWQEAHTSRATLRRFWRGENIQRESFIAICEAVGITNWQQVVEAGISSPVTIVNRLVDESSHTPITDWDEAPDLALFCGRSPELKRLTDCVLRDRRRVVSITGLPGVGKTALTLAFADRVQTQFEGVIWRSSGYYTSMSDLIASLLVALGESFSTPQKSLLQLATHLKQHRYLIVLDGIDSLYSTETSSDSASTQQSQILLSRLMGLSHRSCILTTSRTPLSFSTATSPHLVSLPLNGLDLRDAISLLNAWGISGCEPEQIALVQCYGGNPLGIQLAVPIIQSMFGGNVGAFFRQNHLFVGDRLRALLQQILDQISSLEHDILYWLAIWKEPIPLSRLQTHLMPTPNPMQVLESLMQLEGRSLIAKSFVGDEPAFSLPPLILDQVTTTLVEQATQDLLSLLQGAGSDLLGDRLTLWHTHALVRPGTDDVDGDRILSAIVAELENCGDRPHFDTFQVLHDRCEGCPPQMMGYVPHNLSALSRVFSLRAG